MSSRGIAAAVLLSLAAGAACRHTDPGLAPELRGASTYDEHVRPLIAEYCLPCHEPVGSSGGLVLDAEATEREALGDPTLWAQVRRRGLARRLRPRSCGPCAPSDWFGRSDAGR
jgi:hypothetical protein